MNDLPTAIFWVFIVLSAGALLFFLADRIEKWTERKQKLEMQREALRQRETRELIREMGAQMLNTLRPGEEPPPLMEEKVQSVTDGSEWWSEPGDMTDPTDETMPDPDRTEETDPGVPNLG